MLNSISFFLFDLIWKTLSRVVIRGLWKYKQCLSYKLLKDDLRETDEQYGNDSIIKLPQEKIADLYHL
jgi:hypothetical protein